VANLSYAQLERLWIQAGGSKSLAPVMAAIAMAESGGNPAALNPSDNGGTQTSWGLWQISNGTHSPPGPNPLTPLGNARLAVAKYRSQGLSAWSTYDSGAYQSYLHGGVPPAAATAAAQGDNTAVLTSFLAGPQGMLQDTETLLHGTAVVLDRAFAMFAPGQGWRIAFGTGAAVSGAGAVKAFQAGGEDDGGNLPLSILLAGVAAVAAFMALRPWPQEGGQPIKPGAYAVDVLKGEPPPAGPGAIPAGEVDLTEAGLATLIGLWAAGKAASGLGNAANAASGLGKILGPIWNWIKGIGKSGEDIPIEEVPA
jgi:hypothetical protein